MSISTSPIVKIFKYFLSISLCVFTHMYFFLNHLKISGKHHVFHPKNFNTYLNNKGVFFHYYNPINILSKSNIDTIIFSVI